MTDRSWHPGKIMEISGAYWQTCTLHAGVKLDVFTAIGDASMSAEAIAEKLAASPDGTARLLNALTAMGLLDKNGDRFANTEASRAFLCKTSERYLGHMIMHHHHLVASWSEMDQAVRTGKPVRSRASFSDPAQREAFLMGMFNNAMMLAPQLVGQLDLAGRKHLLDLGGGPGTYAIHFCMANPGLKATVYDLPTTRPFAEQTIERFGMTGRIDFSDGDYTVQGIRGALRCGLDVPRAARRGARRLPRDGSKGGVRSGARRHDHDSRFHPGRHPGRPTCFPPCFH